MEWIREVVDFWVGFGVACFIGGLFAAKLYFNAPECEHNNACDEYKAVLTLHGFECVRVGVAEKATGGAHD